VADERKQLVSLLPSLLKRLQDGMALVGISDAERDHLFAGLVKCHADAIKSGLDEADQSTFQVQEFDAKEAANQAEEPVEFMEIPVQKETIEPDPAFIQAVSDESESDVPWQGSMETSGDEYDAMVNRLKRGTWIEFKQENGAPTRVKLTWVSPLKGVYLFTNRLGEKAFSIAPAGLSMKLRDGHAQIIDDVALVDRALNNLMERLKQAA
jgi:hypothetical protein